MSKRKNKPIAASSSGGGLRSVRFKAGYWSFEETEENELIIHVSGLTKDQKTVHVVIEDFTPFVYLELPKRIEWNASKCRCVFEHFQDILKSNGPLSFKPQIKENLYYRKKMRVMLLTFPTIKACKIFAKKCTFQKSTVISQIGTFRGGEFQVHEQNIDPIIKFTADRGIRLADWIVAKERIPEGEVGLTVEERKFTSADIDLHCFWKDLRSFKPKKLIFVQPKYCSFDIECYSRNHNSKLPEPEIRENVVFQIAMIFGYLGNHTAKKRKVLLSLHNPHEIEDVEVIRAKSERDLLLKFTAFIKEENPDIFIGYNIMKFDWNYMIKRAEKKGFYPRFMELSRIMGRRAENKEANWSSAAYGEQKFCYPDAHGRTNVDVLLEVERNYKLNKYSLNRVSEYFLKECKDDITPVELFMLYQITDEILPRIKGGIVTGDFLKEIKKRVGEIFFVRKIHGVVKVLWKKLLRSTTKNVESLIREGLTLTGKYCVQDTVLPIRLTEKLNLWTTMEEMSNVMHVPVSYLHTRGQQIKVLAQVYREASKKNMIIPNNNKKKDETKYQGAIVIEAHPGDYDNVGTLDFASLYPTVMISFNICYTTILEDDDPTPDEECHVLEWSDHVRCPHDSQKRKKKNKNDTILCQSLRYRFRKVKTIIHDDGTIERQNEGLLPQLERTLLSSRKVVKKEMAKADARLKMQRGQADEDDLKYYRKMKYEIIEQGSLGKNQEMMLQVTHNVFDATQKAIKVSCNSVAPHTPIPCLIDDKFCYYGIEELFDLDNFEEDDDGNQVCKSIFPDAKVWSEEGWTSIKYVIRHRIKEPLIRILTHTGCVDVTPQHSLLRSNGVQVKPENVKVGDSLLHHDTPLPNDTPDNPRYKVLTNKVIDSHNLTSREEDEAFVFGLFLAEGTCGEYGAGSTAKCTWTIYNKEFSLLKRAEIILNKYFGDCQFKICDYGPQKKTLPSGKTIMADLYHLKAFGRVKQLTQRFRKMFYTKRKEKKVPNYILTSPYATRLAFLLGYYRGDGSRFLKTGVVIQNKGQIAIASLLYLAKSIGYNKVSISFPHDEVKIDIFRLQCSNRFRNQYPDRIKRKLPSPDPPKIQDTKKKVIRNETNLVPDGNGYYHYKDIIIECSRLPRQKLLDSLDRIQKASSNRGKIIKYITRRKRVEYRCDNCSSENSCQVQAVLKGSPPSSKTTCSCPENLRYDEDSHYFEPYQEAEYVEYIYDLETENHHFAAGIGNMIVHNSMYGILGARTGFIPLIPGAASVTSMGRKLIMMAIEKIKATWSFCKLVYGDTDSCMIVFEGKTREESFELCESAGEVVTHYLKSWIAGRDETFTVVAGGENYHLNEISSKHEDFELLSYEDKVIVVDYEMIPIDLEFENMYSRFLLLTKKRYCANVINRKGKIIGKTNKGNVMVRRDNANYLKTVYGEMRNIILDAASADIDCEKEVMEVLYDGIQNLFTRKVPETDLIIYMGVKSIIKYAKRKEKEVGRTKEILYYLDENDDKIDDPVGPLDPRLVYPNLPQALLALKMLKRGTDIPPNTRLEFIYIENPEAQHQGEKAEDYAYFKENKIIERLKPDFLHYVEKQLVKPVTEILNVKYPRPPVYFETFDNALKRVLSSPHLNELKRSRVFSTKRHPPYTPPLFEPKDCVIGWEAIGIKRDYPPPQTYFYVAKESKAVAVIHSARRGKKNDFDPNDPVEAEIIDACKRWKARFVLDKLRGSYGVKKKPIRKPKQIQQNLPLKTPIVIQFGLGGYPRHTSAKLVDVREEIVEKKKSYFYTISIQDDVFRNVPRTFITTMYPRDGAIMKDVFGARAGYKQVVEHIHHLFCPIVFN